MSCSNITKTIFSRQVLCAGSMRNYIYIYQRSITNTDYDTLAPTETFTQAWTGFCKAEAISPTTRFDGVNIDNDTTHAFYIPFKESIYELDYNSLFIKQVGTNSVKDRYYKLKGIKNHGEQSEYLVIFAKETGFVATTAAQA